MDGIHVCHAGNDNKTMGGAYLVARRAEVELRPKGIIFDYLTMDEFIEREAPDLNPLPGSKIYAGRLRKNRWLGHLMLPFFAYSAYRKERYKIVHIDTDLATKALIYAIPAKISGAKVVLHSHASGSDGDYKGFKNFCQHFCKQLVPLFADRYLACSQSAKRWMFPKRVWDQVEVLLNGTDLEKFYFSDALRQQWRQKIGVGAGLLLGNIGLLCKRKNQTFLIKLTAALKERGIDAALLLVGSYAAGMEAEIRECIEKCGVKDRVILYGFSADTCALLNAMDVYVCPSHSEGMPLTLCEAQATGLPCIMSDTIADDVMLTDWIAKESLSADMDVWCDWVLKMHEKYAEQREARKVDEKYGIKHMAVKLEEIYSNLLAGK